MKTYFYTAYGLTIESEIPCSFLLEIPAAAIPADVKICFGVVPGELDGAVAKGVLYQAKPNQFLMRLDQVAAFLISNGQDILVERAPESTDDAVLLFLFGSAFGALLHQRGLLVLHASAIETRRGAVLFMGHSGCGKSTVAAAFHKHGYRVLTDDVCALTSDLQGRLLALPGFPQLKIWDDAAEALKYGTESLRRVRPNLEKFALPLQNGFADETLPLYTIYHLTSHNRQELKLEAVGGAEKFGIILLNTYRSRFLGGLEMRADHFKLATAAGETTRIMRIIRPSAPFMLDELLNLVEKDIREG